MLHCIRIHYFDYYFGITLEFVEFRASDCSSTDGEFTVVVSVFTCSMFCEFVLSLLVGSTRISLAGSPDVSHGL